MESKHIKKEIFLGFNAYTEFDADIFKGRDADIEHLYDLVSNKDYVLCYAESGEGKSSLLDAGLTPRLRTNRYFPVKIAFTDEEYNNNNIVFDEVIKSRIMEAVSEQQNLSFVPKSDSIFNEKYSNDLWWFLRNNTLSLYGISFTIVLIFDQFEEVINYPKSDAWTSRFFAFIEKISADDCPQYILDDINATVDSHDDLDFPNIPLKKNFKAIFSIRTEYIGELDYWCMQRYFIPDLKHNRFCLKPLTMQGAEEVMKQYDGFDEELRDNILNVLVKSADNQSSESYVSALILSVVCTSLYQNNDKQLTVSYISGSLENFYNDIINKCGISIEDRNIIASVLVDKDKRVRVASECSALEKISFNKKYKDALLQNRLIKKSIVNGVEYIELVHDSLIDVVKKHKEEALMKEARRRRRRNTIILTILLSIIAMITTLVVQLKNNEKNLLITQAKFIAAEAENLADENNTYDAIRLLNYVANNNKESLNESMFEHAVRTVYCNNDFPEKCFEGLVEYSKDGKYVITIPDEGNPQILMFETSECLYTLHHDDYVNSAEFSSDGKYVVTASDDKTCKIWLVESGECLYTIYHDDEVYATFSPDGKYVLTSSDDNTSKIILVKTGECIYTLHYDYDDASWDAKFSSDGKYVVMYSLNGDACVKVWSVESGECLSVIDGYDRIRLSADGKFIVAFSNEYKTCNIRSNKGESLYTLNDDNVFDASINSDTTFMVTLARDNAKIWSLDSGRCLHYLNHKGYINSAEFSNNGEYVVTASNDKTCKVWSVRNGECLCTLNMGENFFSAKFIVDDKYIIAESSDCTMIWDVKDILIKSYAEFSTDGKCLVTVDNGICELWDVESDTLIDMLNRNDYYVTCVEFSTDGKYVVVVSFFNDSIKIWSIDDREYICTLNHNCAISAEFSSDNKYVVTSSCDTIKIWSVDNCECIKTICEENVKLTELSPDNRFVLIASEIGGFKIWDIDCEKYIYSKDDYYIYSAEFSQDGSFFIVDCGLKSRIHSSETGELVYTNSTFSADGKYVITIPDKYFTDTTKVCYVDNGECIHILDRAINNAKFSADDKFIITRSAYDTIKIWSMENGKCMGVIYDENIRSAKLGPDNRFVLSLSSDDGICKIWDAYDGECIQTICYDDYIKSAEFSPDSKYVVVESFSDVQIYPILTPLSEILDKWSEILGPNAELTKEEKEKYFLN